MRAKFSLEEVGQHCSDDDCWVVVRGAVCDVTPFLSRHPGGAAALCKAGRAGCDVTEHFDRIGHSASAWTLLVEELQIGVLQDASSPTSGAPALAAAAAATRTKAFGAVPAETKVEDDDSHGNEWHARRRQAILQAHPEVAELMGHNPLTPLVGLFASVLHASVCLWVCQSERPLAWALALGYTVGAWCKMMHFAVCHEVCHQTAGSLVKPRFAQMLSFTLLTLPSIGGETQHYYAYQHIGHHGHLGALPQPASTQPGQPGTQAGSKRASPISGPGSERGELTPSPLKSPQSPLKTVSELAEVIETLRLKLKPAAEVIEVDVEEASHVPLEDAVWVDLEEEEDRATAALRGRRRRETSLELVSHDDFDGDLPAPSSLLLLVGGEEGIHKAQTPTPPRSRLDPASIPPWIHHGSTMDPPWIHHGSYIDPAWIPLPQASAQLHSSGERLLSQRPAGERMPHAAIAPDPHPIEMPPRSHSDPTLIPLTSHIDPTRIPH